MHKSHPRLLVLSNNSFSKRNSNGRTLGSLLQGWPKDSIAQFCISSEGADFDVCENYYCITDADVMKSTLKMRPALPRKLGPEKHVDANNTSDGRVKHRKTSFKMLLRNTAWMLGFWRGKSFYEWIEAFSPDLILLQSGDSYFMHDLALKLAKRTGARLAVFNTEGFYLFKNDYYMRDGVLGRALFKLYSALYKKKFRKFMQACSKQIYCNTLLQRDYGREFGDNSIVIYTASNIEFCPKEMADCPRFSYLGNLGFDRPGALIEFANAIAEINKDYVLDVYGFAKDQRMIDRLNSCNAIHFHGAVSYDKVKEIMAESDFLIHAESQDAKWKESLRYGFSTKVADSIASGKLFILYSSPEIACAKYVNDTCAGIFASNTEDLKKKIVEVISSASLRERITEHARTTAQAHHNPANNVRQMEDYLMS